MNFKKWCCTNPNLGILLIRIAVASIFIFHGVQKLTHMDMTVGFFSMMGIPVLFAYLVPIIETLGGIMILLGLWTGVAGTLLSVVMVFAILLVKRKMGWQAMEIDVLLLASVLGIVFSGPGKHSYVGCCNTCSCGTCSSCKDGVCNQKDTNTTKSCSCGCGECKDGVCNSCSENHCNCNCK